MRGRTPKAVAAVGAVAALGLVVAGCTSTPATHEKTVLRIYASEPAFLVPMSASDDPSIQVIRELYRGLVRYDNDTGEAKMDLAESIESTDATNWTIKLKDGFKFTNGEAVDADSFIRAWNYTAYGPNAEDNAYFYSKIKGIDEVSGDTPAAQELSGLKKVDDLTFTVELSAPFAAFPATLGYSGFFPVAKACIDDLDACNETPIGNGPYKIEGSWQHDEKITLVKNADFAGDGPGVADELDFTIYADVNAGYAAFQAGDLDIMYTLPPGKFAEAQETYGDHLFTKASDSFTYLGFPVYQTAFQNKLVRQAISLSIDRQAIIDGVLDGLPVAAQGFVSPNFDGYRPGACANCSYNPTKAKELLAQAGGWNGGTLQLYANAGAGHDEWLKVVGDQIQAALGIPYELNVSLEFPEYLDTADNHGFTGPFRLGWGPDYPVLETYLGPLYYTGASSNYGGYSNPEFDAAVDAGNAADTTADAIKEYQKAEDILVDDLPVVPMWFGRYTVVYGDNVTDMVFNSIAGRPKYGEIVVK
jgi:ABC-type oligopeptide transport system substrate-binding subunit